LGFALQEKYSLNLPAVHMLQCEAVNHRWVLRGSDKEDYIDTWPTFTKLVDELENRPDYVKTVKMWGIDTVDGIVPKILLHLCDAHEVLDPHDKAWGSIYGESQDELECAILRLRSMGPGVMLFSHERSVEVRRGKVTVPQANPDMSEKMRNRMLALCSMWIRMRPEAAGGKERRGRRCLVAVEGDTEYAKDNYDVVRGRYPNGVIGFDTEREAVDKLLACFSGVKRSKKKVSKHKKSSKKKAVRR